MLGMALGGRPGVEEVVLFDRDPDVAAMSLDRGAGDRVEARVENALGADTVVVALPVGEIVKILDRFGSSVRSGTLVMDTGSAKTVVVDAMRRSLPESVAAVGAHPMVGTEIPGPAGARPERLRGAPFVLTPARDDPAALARARDLVFLVEARPVVLTAEEHDRLVARSSHLPHVAAFAVAIAAARADGRTAFGQLVSTGFEGATRLARSDPAMVASFLSANRHEVRAAVADMAEALTELASALDDPELLGAELARARRFLVEAS